MRVIMDKANQFYEKTNTFPMPSQEHDDLFSEKWLEQ